jgi:acyl-CoA synthetase (NDP forming)
LFVPGAGFAEGGEQGLALQAQLVATAARYDIKICGPNNLGFLNYHERVACWVTNVPEIVKPGDVALVTQIGSVGIAISQDGRELQLGYLVGAGNEANVGAADYLDYFVRDERINVVLLFLETLRDTARFGAAADEARR